ncbi:iron-containing redox enzyme family protein [Pseudomonas sp. SWRI59]|uniref:iron-containing redox enzyme family protein n=1 Tax=Pseudomonas TaxID=286 RepID=UPI0016485CFC|nr:MULTISPECIES: iron-containing redox enzyme family protein [unclassified Pseudomonas]MBC3502171.1 iron-containing redox enzyme family protein [Pseudomonas sp. SWRI59]MBC3506069.1 iron-containing redox enzyme family protein [Pseudomonas sp. SWRI68]UVL02312.1 iron-containing redox enzyme family protein [Pseudomonas sp. B21-047]
MGALVYEDQKQLAVYYKKAFGAPESIIGLGRDAETLRRSVYSLENNWNAVEEGCIDLAGLPKVKAEFINWYLVMERRMNSDIRFFIEFLRRKASLEQIAYYICMEELVDGAFDDLMAMVQLGMPLKPKMVAAENYWDEMGGGNAAAVHTVMFKDSSIFMRDILRQANITAEQPTLECLMNGNVLLMWALRREYNVRLIGAIGIIEGSAPVRFRATTEALERLQVPKKVIAYHQSHISIDTRHSNAWLEVVLDYYAGSGEEVVRELALGVSIRYNVALRYYHHMYQMMRSISQ